MASKFKPTNAQKKRIGLWLAKWQKRLNLQEWDSEYIKFEEYNDPDSPQTSAMIRLQPSYFGYGLHLYPRFFQLYTPSQQERMIVHELCHILTDELCRMAKHGQDLVLIHRIDIKDATERLTQRICNAVWKDK